jgi:hypothetical protein
MSIFASPHAIAARKTVTRCANCRHNEAIIADLQAKVADLRKSQDQWRDLALDAPSAQLAMPLGPNSGNAATDSLRAA